jgi:biopolymer transport protein ExbD
MAMNIGSPNEDGSESVMSDINTTPLVDVMLVLLIIFLITVPVVIQTVPLKLPTVTNIATQTKPENLVLSVNSNCEVFKGQQKIDSKEDLTNGAAEFLRKEIERQKAAGGKLELPEAHIRGDANAEYRCIGGVIFSLQRAGFLKIGFISEPAEGSVTR